jgi:hypothetical protein
MRARSLSEQRTIGQDACHQQEKNESEKGPWKKVEQAGSLYRGDRMFEGIALQRP